MPSELLETMESHFFIKHSQSEQTDFSTEGIKQENISIMYIFQTHITLISQDNILKSLLSFQNSLFTQAI